MDLRKYIHHEVRSLLVIFPVSSIGDLVNDLIHEIGIAIIDQQAHALSQ